MKDNLGNDLTVGDTAHYAYTRWRGCVVMRKGVVTKLGEKFVFFDTGDKAIHTRVGKVK